MEKRTTMAKKKVTQSNPEPKKEQERTKTAKALMLQALENNLGIASAAAKQVGINPKTHYEWMNVDPDYRADVEALSELTLDFAESELFKQMKKGQAASTIFFLKTKGKKRGYSEEPIVKIDAETAIFKGLDIGLSE